jgi:hypothetical protein
MTLNNARTKYKSFTGKIFCDLNETNSPHTVAKYPHPLNKLNNEELLFRFSEIADSMWIFNPELEVTRFLLPDFPIWKAGIQCVYEIKQRKLDNELVFIFLDSRIGINGKSIKPMLGDRHFPQKKVDIPVKFMKKMYLNDFLKKGTIRFSPATMFIDKTLSIAQQDNEIEYTSYVNPAGVRIISEENPEEEIPIIDDGENMKFSRNIKTNYYLFSTTCWANARHFLDFDTDVCVFIENPNEFINRIKNAIVTQHLNLECDSKFFPVKYYDKYEYSKYAMPLLSKDIKYWYQFEIRLTLMPPIGKSIKELEPLVLSIGSIEDITSIYQLV